eukprot:2636015-Alexandrium_andersonii.AAC.1
MPWASAARLAAFGRRPKDKIRGSTAHAAVSARFQRLPALPLRGGYRPPEALFGGVRGGGSSCVLRIQTL